MSDSTVPAIDEKSQQQTSSSTSSSNSTNANWRAFMNSAFGAVITIILFALIGANFITLINFEPLSLLIPIDPNHYFKETTQTTKLKAKKVVQNNSMPCKYGQTKTKINFGMSMPALEDLGINGNAFGWPYTMYKKGASELSFNGFENWFAKTTAGSYIFMRETLYKGLGSPILKSMMPIVLFFIALLVVSIAPIALPFIASIFILPYKGFTNGEMGWLWTLLGLFFVWTPMMMGCNMVIQYLQILALFLLYPLVVDSATVFSILRCNKWWLSLMFGLFIVSAGYTNLGTTPGTVMLFAWLFLVFKQMRN